MKIPPKPLLLSGALLTMGCLPGLAQTSPPFNQCPAVGADTSCAILITVDAHGSLRVDSDPSQGPFDGIEDTLIGVQNNSSKPIGSIPLKSPLPIFGFDGDGLCFFVSCTWPHPTNYEGSSVSNPGLAVSFAVNSQTSGTVSFSPSIPPGGSAFFSLEERIQTLCPPITGVPVIKQNGSATPSDAGGTWGPDTYDHDHYTNTYANAATTPIVTPPGTMELVIIPVGTGGQQDHPAGTSYDVTLSSATNNLNGLRAAINALGVTGLTANVLTSATNGLPYLSIVYLPAASALQLRQMPGDPASNILQHISRWGCYLTSSVMLINYHAVRLGLAFRTTPRQLNNWLNENGGFSGDLVVPSAVAQYAQANGIQLSYDGSVNGRDDFTLDSYVCNGNPVLLRVGNPHFVVATGQITVGADNTYSVNDPANYANDSTLEGFGFTYSGLRLFSTNTTNPSALYVVGHSPIELLVTDPNGRRTGVDPVSGTALNEIPESSYNTEFLADDIDLASGNTTSQAKEFSLLNPLPGDYAVQVIGNGSGPFSLDFIGYDLKGSQSRVTLVGNTSPGANAPYKATYSSVPGSQIQAVSLDTTPPAITVSASPAMLWPPNGKMVPVVMSGTVTDNESGGTGINPSSVNYAVMDEYGRVQPSGPLTLDANGNYSLMISLEAARNGDDKDGRQYKIFVNARDNAGNLGSAFAVVTVPHDQRH